MEDFNKPLSGLVTPRFGAIATFMRMPHVSLEDAEGIDIGMVGIPWDGGTTNRPGPRHGPRQMRDMSSMVRPMHQTSHVTPSKLANIADLGDCPVNPADVMDGLKRVETYFKALVAKGIRPLSAGGDHLCSLPVLRAVGEKQPVGMIHFDAHTDLYDALKIGLISMDSTIKSNLGVGLPIDIAVTRSGALDYETKHRIDASDPYFRDLRERWSSALREAHMGIPRPQYGEET